MKYYTSKSIPEKMVHAEELVITIAVDEGIRARLEAAGYDDTAFSEMQQLVENAQRLDTNQQVQLGKQTAATNVLNEQTQAIRLKFVSDRRMVRHALKNNRPLTEELRLHIKTKSGREALIRQMAHFYEEVIKYDDLVNQLVTQYTLTLELFTARQQEVLDLAQAMQVQQFQVGQARNATREKREAIQQLDTWMRAFIGMARQVFRDEAGTLRKLRIHTQPRSRSVIPPDTPYESEVL